jgi:hypothetical protein
MTTEIVWNVSQMDCYPQTEGETNVVFNIHWQCNGTDGTYNASIYSTCSVTYVAGTPYTAYADLTQSQVLGWVWANGVSKEATEAAVEAQLQAQINPPVVTPALPWSAA